MARIKNLPVTGWREWVDLSAIGAGLIIAKVDTGACSSALHAEEIEKYVEGGKVYLAFIVDHQGSNDAFRCLAKLRGWRRVKSSTGQSSLRPVVQTTIAIASYKIRINITLANRSEMQVPMLLGRAALRQRFLVDPTHSFLLTKPDAGL